MKLKMPGPNGTITLASDPDIALRAKNKTVALALEALSEALAAKELTALCSMVDRDDVILDKRPKSTSFKPADEIVKFQVHPTDSTKTASIGAQLDPKVDAALRAFLRKNWDIFAWHPSDMPCIPPLQKKDTSVTFWPNEFFFCHTYDTSMTIIVTKPDIIIDVVGSYFYDKKS